MKYFIPLTIIYVIFTCLQTILTVPFLTYSQDPCIYCNGEHVACNLSMKFQNTCYSNVKVEPMPQQLRNLILDEHNKYRNLLAGGGVPGLISAIRMATLRWHIEFEYLALLNLLKCYMAHDKCRRTPEHPYCGQNLAYLKFRGVNFTIQDILTRLMGYWYDEYKLCTMNDMLAYPNRSLPMIGHFAMLVQERATHVGCSCISQVSDTNIKEYYFACDYSYINIFTIPVYRSGPKASACQTGTNPQYPNLCSINEVYNISTYRY